MKKFFQIFFKYWIRPWAPFVLLFTPLTFADNETDINQIGGERFELIIDYVIISVLYSAKELQRVNMQ